MDKIKLIKTRTASELFEALNISPAQGAEIIFRSDLNSKIIQVVKRKKMTPKQLAQLTGRPQKQITSLLNRDVSHISTDQMLQILSTLGYQPRLKAVKAA